MSTEENANNKKTFNIEDAIGNLRKDIASVKDEIRSDIASIKTDISEMKEDISKLKSTVETLDIQRRARNAYLEAGAIGQFNDMGAGFQRRNSANATRSDPQPRRLWIG